MKTRKLRLNRTCQLLNRPWRGCSRQSLVSNLSVSWEARFNRLPFFLPLYLFLSLFADPAGASTNTTCSASYLTDAVPHVDTIDQFGANFQTVNVFSFEFNGQCRVVAKSPWVEQ